MSSPTATAASRRFSSSAKAAWAAVVVALLLLAVLLVVHPFTRGGDERRDAVAEYIRAVNRIQIGLGAELTSINRLYRQLRFDTATLASQSGELERSVRTLRRLRARVAGLDAPPEAAALERQLLRLADLQIALAAETSQLGRYVPELASAERKLADATSRMRRDLRAATTRKGQARALGRYDSDLRAVGRTLATLAAPPVLEPARRSEEARVRRMADAAGPLRDAVVEARRRDAERLVRTLAAAAAEPPAIDAQRAAVTAYQRRIRRIAEQQAAVERERVRLDRTLQS